MSGLTTRSVIDTLVMIALGGGAAWRGYGRRRAYWSRDSWIRFGLTLLTGFTLIGFTLYFSADVDRPWMGAPGSGTRAAWIVVVLACLLGGTGLTTLCLAWFAQGDPTKPFTLRRFTRTIRAVLRPPPAERLQVLAPEPGSAADGRSHRELLILLLALSPIFASATQSEAQSALKTENVVLIVSDGLRWQEIFRGPDRPLMSRAPGGVSDTSALLRKYWRDDVTARRAVLFPFIWGTVAREGQIFGNQDKGSVARIENTFRFSYPGYNEMLTGRFDPRVNSNDYPANPNVTVFEFLARDRAFRGKVAAIATWDAFDRIFNRERAGIDVIAGWSPPFTGELARSPRGAMLNDLYRTSVRYWGDNTFDAPMHLVTKEYLAARKPRLLFVGYGETDEWAHGGRYDLVLESAHQMDSFVADLWATMQSMPQYRGKTTFIITTDHGRGSGDREWKNHGEKVEGAENIWIAVIGPDTPPAGERTNTSPVTQSQIAATIASLVGMANPFRALAPNTAPPLPIR